MQTDQINWNDFQDAWQLPTQPKKEIEPIAVAPVGIVRHLHLEKLPEKDVYMDFSPDPRRSELKKTDAFIDQGTEDPHPKGFKYTGLERMEIEECAQGQYTRLAPYVRNQPPEKPKHRKILWIAMKLESNDLAACKVIAESITRLELDRKTVYRMINNAKAKANPNLPPSEQPKPVNVKALANYLSNLAEQLPEIGPTVPTVEEDSYQFINKDWKSRLLQTAAEVDAGLVEVDPDSMDGKRRDTAIGYYPLFSGNESMPYEIRNRIKSASWAWLQWFREELNTANPAKPHIKGTAGVLYGTTQKQRGYLWECLKDRERELLLSRDNWNACSRHVQTCLQMIAKGHTLKKPPKVVKKMIIQCSNNKQFRTRRGVIPFDKAPRTTSKERRTLWALYEKLFSR
jgi:hypothetical protein